MRMRRILARTWHPKREDVDLWKYAHSFMLLPFSLLFILLLAVLLPERPFIFLLVFLYFGMLVLRGIVIVRAAYTLPIPDEKKRGLGRASAGSDTGTRILAACILLLSPLGLLVTVKYFFIIFITMTMISVSIFAYGGLSTAVFLVISAVLTLLSIAVSAIQGGWGGVFASVIMCLIAFPMAFETFIELRGGARA